LWFWFVPAKTQRCGCCMVLPKHYRFSQLRWSPMTDWMGRFQIGAYYYPMTKKGLLIQNDRFPSYRDDADSWSDPPQLPWNETSKLRPPQIYKIVCLSAVHLVDLFRTWGTLISRDFVVASMLAKMCVNSIFFWFHRSIDRGVPLDKDSINHWHTTGHWAGGSVMASWSGTTEGAHDLDDRF